MRPARSAAYATRTLWRSGNSAPFSVAVDVARTSKSESAHRPPRFRTRRRSRMLGTTAERRATPPKRTWGTGQRLVTRCWHGARPVSHAPEFPPRLRGVLPASPDIPQNVRADRPPAPANNSRAKQVTGVAPSPIQHLARIRGWSASVSVSPRYGRFSAQIVARGCRDFFLDLHLAAARRPQ